MKTVSRMLPFALTALLLSVIFFACKKDQSATTGGTSSVNTRYSVFLTDAPAFFQQVLINVQKVEIKLDTCQKNSDPDRSHPGCDNSHDSLDTRCSVWKTLDVAAGTYDMLKLQNGIDTLVAAGITGGGKVERIKITLAMTGNSVMLDSMSYPLNLDSNRNYVYINIDRDHLDSASADDLQLHLDFDLLHSIRFINGQYWLNPVLRPFGKHSTGEIKGNIEPAHSFGAVLAFNGTDTAYSRPGERGEFEIGGLKDGTYSLQITGLNGYKDTTISNISVRRQHQTNLGNIQLHQ